MDKMEADYKSLVDLVDELNQLSDRMKKYAEYIQDGKVKDTYPKAEVADDIAIYANEIARTVKPYLGVPRKNFEMGTPMEQLARFNDFCSRNRCDTCPLKDFGGIVHACQFMWSHMDYNKQ